jgi:nucleoid-associated protein YgaU
MAANTKSSKSRGAKKPVQKKNTSKPAPKKKPAAKKAAKPGQKSIAKPVTRTAAVKVPQKPPAMDKKTSEAGLAFEKKIDQMSKKSPASQNSGKIFLKTLIGILIIIAAAVLVYLFYPKGKTVVIKEDTAGKSVPPQEVKLPEPPKETVKPKANDETIYVVKYKDQLTEISKKYYGNFIEWKRIYAANKDKIKNPHLIFPGQELVIPKKQK